MNAEADALYGLFARPGAGWLQPMLPDWPTAACRWLEQEGVVVRVLVAEVRGSGPREAGACMLVAASGIEGTIGGGNLEWHAIEAAKRLLTTAGRGENPAANLQRFTLGPELAQCCGGVVQLWIERFTRTDLPMLRRAARAAQAGASASLATLLTPKGVVRSLSDASSAPLARVRVSVTSDGNVALLERIDRAVTPVFLYGAGHTGQAVVRMLTELPFRITWIDSRGGLFPQPLPDNVRVLSEPASAVSRAPRSARHIVMTHDHALDYDICHAILKRNEFAWLGLIGSASKAARFRSRLKRDGVAPEQVERLVCPIGLTDIPSKLPAAIAIGIAAQLLRETTALPALQRASETDGCGDCECSSCPQAHR